MNIIAQVVARCSIGASNRQVIRYAISRLKNKNETFWDLSKPQRRNFMAMCIKEHTRNIEEYKYVVGGLK